jgi:SAM-dependent methyltransferase
MKDASLAAGAALNGRACPLCRHELEDAPLWTVTDHLKMAAGPLAFFKCRNCASAILDPMPTSAELKAAYPENYSFRPQEGGIIPRLLKSVEYDLFYRNIFSSEARLLRALPLPKGARLLDIGCGEGHRTAYLRKLGFRAEGLDTSVGSVDFARRTYGLTAYAGSLEDRAEALRGRYDVVTMYNVFEHLPDPATTLAGARTALRESGWLLLTSPLSDGLAIRLFGPRHLVVREAPRHVIIPSSQGLNDFLRRSGFGVARRQAASLLGRAGLVGLSLSLSGAYASAARGGAMRYFFARSQAALATLVAGIPLSLAEYVRGPFSSIIIACRAAGGGERP